jgi:hypothetical protein
MNHTYSVDIQRTEEYGVCLGSARIVNNIIPAEFYDVYKAVGSAHGLARPGAQVDALRCLSCTADRQGPSNRG